jgi:hypothetical protein
MPRSKGPQDCGGGPKPAEPKHWCADAGPLKQSVWFGSRTHVLSHNQSGGQHAEPQQRCCNGRFRLRRYYSVKIQGTLALSLNNNKDARLPKGPQEEDIW